MASRFLISVLLPCVCIIGVYSIEIQEGNFEGTYERISGANSCPSRIRFDEDGRNVNTNRVLADGARCSGPAFAFRRNDRVSGDRLVSSLQQTPRSFEANWVTGRSSGAVTCRSGNVNIRFDANQRFTFFSLDGESRTIQWSDVYGRPANQIPIAGRNNGFTIREDRFYLITGDGECLYQDQGFAQELADDAEEAAEKVEDNVCFPANAEVALETGRMARMDQLAVGDRVLVGKGVYSDVYFFTHSDPSYSASIYARIRASDGSEITLTRSHYIYADGKLIPAGQVKIGDTLTKGDGSTVKVTSVAPNVREKGLYNPQTLHGDIVVNDIRASTYTEFMESKVAHRLLAPVRGIYRLLIFASSNSKSDL